MVNKTGKGRLGGVGLGLGGNCVCSNCGIVVAHQRAVPCIQQKCPKCGSNMARQQ